MKLLLDTHVAIWAVDSSDFLPPNILALMENRSNDLYVSAVTLWEISIKFPLQRRENFTFSAAAALRKFVEAEFQFLHVTADHAVAVESLPPLHGDPFDRLLVAQAMTEPMRLLTADKQLAAYSDTIITW